MKKNKTILFDWDDTLFSKTEFKKNLSKNLAGICGTSDGEILKIQENYINDLKQPDHFRIDSFLKYLGQKFDKNIDLKDFTSDNLEIYSKSLFPETMMILNKLKNDYNLGIYSQGFDDFQKIKITSSGIKNFFEDDLIYVDKNKLDPDFIKKLPDGTIIIDDKKGVIEKLHSLKKFNLFWLNRANNEKFPGVKTIKSLLEIAE